jgi:hypothetical protein
MLLETPSKSSYVAWLFAASAMLKRLTGKRNLSTADLESGFFGCGLSHQVPITPRALAKRDTWS